MQNGFVIDVKECLDAISDKVLGQLAEEFLNETDIPFIEGAVLCLKDLPEFREFAGYLLKGESLSGADIEWLRDDLQSYLPQVLRAPELYPSYFQAILVGTIVQQTERAVQIQVDATKVWVPKSVLFTKVNARKRAPHPFILRPTFMRRAIAKPFAVKVVRETEKAVMLANPQEKPFAGLDGTPIADTPDLWFPKSVILSAYQEAAGGWLVLVVNWFVQKQVELKQEKERQAREPQTATERVEFDKAIAEIEGFIGLNNLVQTARKAPCKGEKEQIVSAAVPDDHLKVEATWYADSQTLVIFRQQAADRGETLYFSKQKPVEYLL